MRKTAALAIALMGLWVSPASADDCAARLKPDSAGKDVIACIQEQASVIATLRQNLVDSEITKLKLLASQIESVTHGNRGVCIKFQDLSGLYCFQPDGNFTSIGSTHNFTLMMSKE